MKRSAVAVVVGYTKREGLLRKSFAPLRRLKQAGVIDRILYVTWDKPELDAWLADAAAMPEVELVRVPEPEVSGKPYQKKHFYQTHNIATALSLVPGDETLVVKLRPDQVIDEVFLASKILAFDHCCAPSRPAACFHVAMPPSPFKMKVWTPWADSNQPFFLEDGLFAALRGDAIKLVTPAGDDIVRRYGDERSLWITNVARYIAPFLPDYPIFERYLQAFNLFAQNDACRIEMLNAVITDIFFWHLVIANAWILADNFHIDCGRQGQIVFYPPEGIEPGEDKGPDKPFETMAPRHPFDQVETWRAGEKPGSVFHNISRLYGRLMDDSWQHAIFINPSTTDVTRDNLHDFLRNVLLYDHGILAEAENAFYGTVEQIYRRHFPAESEAAVPAREKAA
ncbi:MAG TPA: hypothetical protein VGC27_06825 [Rhizomicrobium sp.]